MERNLCIKQHDAYAHKHKTKYIHDPRIRVPLAAELADAIEGDAVPLEAKTRQDKNNSHKDAETDYVKNIPSRHPSVL